MLPFSALILTSLLAYFVTETNAYQEPPKGLQFLGVGYNLLEGNPDGGDLSNGGIDPGLLFTRKVFKLSYDTNKVSIGRQYLIPDQVSFAPRSSCVTTTKNEVFSGSKSYQNKLTVDVSANGGYDAGLWNVAFTLSSNFEKMTKETSTYKNVFYEEKKVCNRGRARYQLDLAPIKKFPVSEDFAAAVCGLPDDYSERTYFNFIERWGTHIVVEVELGEKVIERSKESQTEFIKHAIQNIKGSVSPSGSFAGFSGSLTVNMDKFREQMTQEDKFGKHKIVLTSGGMDMPEPIGLKLVPVYEALNKNFYQLSGAGSGSPCKHTESLLRSRKDNLVQILKEYPRLKGTNVPIDPPVVIPLTWPQGTYGLPMTTHGCPRAAGFTWHHGYRYHENEIGNSWSYPYHLAGKKSIWTNQQAFCIKTKDQGTKYDLTWSPGQYCLFKKGDCPEGFKTGFIRWDDENSDNNNNYRGAMPDGKFTKNTLIEYCCRTDGHAENDIILPTDTPFVLFKSNSHQCQHVQGMRWKEEWFQWDTEDWSFSGNEKMGSVPYGEVGRNIKLYYCYYYR
ncbi:unnamed protein product [Pocillopora meandrina]|uniref:MACPF domain-containing protein n=1 Tax=Pocillopora meandrina TaxID=46732 RepID=A0AAU9Y1F2_9CNID|nr:unnamed protein product [Pocillopora meandrina]